MFQKEQETNKNYNMSVVYHSMPVSVLKNPIYRKEFMLKFGDHV